MNWLKTEQIFNLSLDDLTAKNKNFGFILEEFGCNCFKSLNICFAILSQSEKHKVFTGASCIITSCFY